MNLHSVRAHLRANGTYLSEEPVLARPTVIGYDKRFRWSWMATQLNTFTVATDLGDEPVGVPVLRRHAFEAFRLAELNYGGWPRGLQSGLAVIQVLISRSLDPLAVAYCRRLAAEKKFAGFVVPVVADPATGEVHYFERKPMWGRIYFSYFREVIEGLAATPAAPPPLRAGA